MEIEIGDKVIAEFPEGDQLELTVKAINKVIYYFEERETCMWWYKQLCKKIN
jgi:hypothetical protein